MISRLTYIGLSAKDLVVDLLVDAVEFLFNDFEIFLVLHKMLLNYGLRLLYIVYVNERSHAIDTPVDKSLFLKITFIFQ